MKQAKQLLDQLIDSQKAGQQTSVDVASIALSLTSRCLQQSHILRQAQQTAVAGVQDASIDVVKVTEEVERVLERMQSLSNRMQDTLHDQQDAKSDIYALADLDLVINRLGTVQCVVRSTKDWGSLQADVKKAAEEHNWTTCAKKVADARASVQAFSDVLSGAEIESRRSLVQSLTVTVSEALSAALKHAISTDDTESARELLRAYTTMGESDQFEETHTKCFQEGLQQLWSSQLQSSTATTLPDHVHTWCQQLYHALTRRWSWCLTVGLPPDLTLARLMEQVIGHLKPSFLEGSQPGGRVDTWPSTVKCAQHLYETVRLVETSFNTSDRNLTERAVVSILQASNASNNTAVSPPKAIVALSDSLVPLSELVTTFDTKESNYLRQVCLQGARRAFSDKTGAVEITDIVQRLLPTLFEAPNSAIDRHSALLRGLAPEKLLIALDMYWEDVAALLIDVLLRIRNNAYRRIINNNGNTVGFDTGALSDGDIPTSFVSHDAISVGLNQSCARIVRNCIQWVEYTTSLIRSLDSRFLINKMPLINEISVPLSDHVSWLSPDTSISLLFFLANRTEINTNTIPTHQHCSAYVSSAKFVLQTSIDASLDVLFSPVSHMLEDLAVLPVWRSQNYRRLTSPLNLEIAQFSVSPTRVMMNLCDYLLALPHHLEGLTEIILDGHMSYVLPFSVKPPHASLARMMRKNIADTTEDYQAYDVLIALLLGVQYAYLSRILFLFGGGATFTKLGVQQLVCDIESLGNTLMALDSPLVCELAFIKHTLGQVGDVTADDLRQIVLAPHLTISSLKTIGLEAVMEDFDEEDQLYQTYLQPSCLARRWGEPPTILTELNDERSTLNNLTIEVWLRRVIDTICKLKLI